MNLIEAIKTGKRFHRGASWLWIDPKQPGLSPIIFSIEDVLFDGWVVEEPKKEFTEAQLREALSEAFFKYNIAPSGDNISYRYEEPFDVFLKKLGF